MNLNYEVITTPTGNTVINLSLENGNMLCIPTDPANSDYQAYLRHLAGEDEAQSLQSMTTNRKVCSN